MVNKAVLFSQRSANLDLKKKPPLRSLSALRCAWAGGLARRRVDAIRGYSNECNIIRNNCAAAFRTYLFKQQ